jgi:hypothetical protein
MDDSELKYRWNFFHYLLQNSSSKLTAILKSLSQDALSDPSAPLSTTSLPRSLPVASAVYLRVSDRKYTVEDIR